MMNIAQQLGKPSKLAYAISIALGMGSVVPSYAEEATNLLSDKELTCVANYSTTTGSLTVPCVKVTSDNLPDAHYSAILQKQGSELDFMLSGITPRPDSTEETACNATYDSKSQIVRIPCLSGLPAIDNETVTNPNAIYAV